MRDLKKRLQILALSLLVLSCLFIFGLVPRFMRTEKTLVIGAKNCTEQQILAELLAQLIEKETDLKVVRRYFLEGTAITFQALLSGGIDTYFEYTGTALLDILKEPLPQEELFPVVQKKLADKHGLVMLNPLGFSNEYRLVARSGEGVKALSELDGDLKIAYDPEFSIRPERKLLEANYPVLRKTSPQLLDQVLLYFSLQNETVDLVSAFSTDSHLFDEKFVVLEDDLGCLPSYEVAPLTRSGVLDKFPELIVLFNQLAGKITVEEMRRLNYLVDCEHREVAEVVRGFL